MKTLQRCTAAMLLTLSLTAPALAADSYALKPSQSVAAALKDLSGRKVTVHLRGGKELSGKLAVVGDEAVQISEISGKEFFDAVIRVEAIDAVELRVR